MGKVTVALDTSVIIYFLEEDSVYFEETYRLLKDIKSGHKQGIFATIGMIELLTGPQRDGRFDLVTKYKRLLGAIDNLAIVTIEEPVIDLAVDLRVRYGLRTPDSIHLATALMLEADYFITNDKALQKVKEIEVKLLSAT